MAACYACGSELPEHFEIHRTTACPNCDKDLHVCRGCTFYAPGAHWDCRETISEPVRDKDRGNFCDFFKVAEGTGGSGGDQSGGDETPKARDDFDRLFGS